MSRVALGNHINAVLFESNGALFMPQESPLLLHQRIAREHFGIQLDDEMFKENWDEPFSNFVEAVYGSTNADAAMGRIAEAYDAAPKRLQHHTNGTLLALREAGLMLGIVTSGTRPNLLQSFRTSGLRPNLFNYTQTREDSTEHKPDKHVFDPAIKWLDDWNIPTREVVYISSELDDMSPALAARLGFIAVATGLTSHQEFARSGAVTIGSLGELALR